MELPEKLKSALAAADDAYLAGLSNKGTLNRGKKDMEALTDVTVTPADGELLVQWGDVRCVIRETLGSSTCSCPSSGFCRHRVAAILWLKSHMGSAPQPAAQTPSFQELRDYPTEKLERVLGERRLSAIRFRLDAGILPEMEQDSVVRVTLPWVGASVRLLEPLAHSTCSCHSASFCIHKAEALLWWQLRNGIIPPDRLRTRNVSPALNPEQIRGICRGVQETLSSLMAVGLSRTPPEICQTVERMASLCHTANLADLERSLRRLHEDYKFCFDRSARFRDTELLGDLARVFRLAEALETAPDEALPTLAGTFRDDYRPVGNLRLYLLGSRTYSGKSGYAGSIYYFWNEENRSFCSFRHIRPTFYEGKARRIPKHAAPWGLPFTLDKAWKNRMELSGAKMNQTATLSSTSECTATLLGKAAPGEVIPGDQIFRDFSPLLERSAPDRSENSRLALISPKKMELQPYDSVRQIYSLRLLDEAGRDLWITVPYDPENARVIEALERMTKGFAGASKSAPVFFGSLYRDGDLLKCYPIEYFLNWEEWE